MPTSNPSKPCPTTSPHEGEHLTYQEALDYLFEATPVFQHIGAEAYKPGLARMQALDAYYGHPHRAYQTIHVGGTNGKGSTSHTLAAILQAAGYRVGLFTSPHLLDFSERIRVNGQTISEDYVCHFTQRACTQITEHQPSFFELTSMMALCYFKDMEVDLAIIEVGLGGRLDSTNIIEPICSVITNISLDHTQYLGSSLVEIAREKAGIIKPQTPIIIGSAEDESVRNVFVNQSRALGAPLSFAQEDKLVYTCTRQGARLIYDTAFGKIEAVLTGQAQRENTATILSTIHVLRHLPLSLEISPEHIRAGFAQVLTSTGLMGRWQTLREEPRLICDTGHNEAGIRGILEQLQSESANYKQIHIILGMASDKDVSAILRLFPKNYTYYFTQASVTRALPVNTLKDLAQNLGLEGQAYPSVAKALSAAQEVATAQDLIFVGGSNFVVADLLREMQKVQ